MWWKSLVPLLIPFANQLIDAVIKNVKDELAKTLPPGTLPSTDDSVYEAAKKKTLENLKVE